MGAANVDRGSEKDSAWYSLVSPVLLWRWSRKLYRASCNPRWDMGSPLWPRVKNAEQQWMHLGSPPPKKFKRVYSAGKVMAPIFRDSQEVIMIEQGRTINDAYYAGEMRWLKSPERGKENWLEVFCSCKTTPLPTRHKLPWLLRPNVDLKISSSHIFS